MSVKVSWGPANEGAWSDSESAKYAYSVSSAGVLTVLKSFLGQRWEIFTQFAPAAWRSVAGLHFVGNVDELGGVDSGSTALGEANIVLTPSVSEELSGK